MTKNESFHSWRPSVVSIRNQNKKGYVGNVIGGAEISTADAIQKLNESRNKGMAKMAEAHDKYMSMLNKTKSAFRGLEEAVSDVADSMMA